MEPTIKTDIPRVAWEDHRAAMIDRYTDEDHVSIIAPTRYGKSHLVHHGIMPFLHNEHVLIIDVKGDDPVWKGVPAKAITELPSQRRRKLDEWYRQKSYPELPVGWYRLIVPEESSREESRFAVYRALNMCKREQNWVIIFDELRAITDNAPNGLNLRGVVDSVYLRGGYKKVTIIGSTQGPRWVPSTFYEQPQHLYLGRIEDIEAQKRLSEIGGNVQLIRSVVANLNKREFLYVGPLQETGPRVMEIVKVDG